MKIELADAEWMSIIDADRDGLPPCCGQISHIRDVLIEAAASGGVAITDMLAEALGDAFTASHTVPSEAMAKVCRAAGFEASAGNYVKIPKEAVS
jgi:hypothetical protein